MGAAMPHTRCAFTHGTPRNHYVRTSLTRWVAHCTLAPALLPLTWACSHPVPESASNRPTIEQSRIRTFVDRLSPSQMDFINKGWLLLFVQNRISFRAIELPSFIEAVSRTRPACVTTGRLPSRSNLGGWMLDDLYMMSRSASRT
jgi:hypothetical protein